MRPLYAVFTHHSQMDESHKASVYWQALHKFTELNVRDTYIDSVIIFKVLQRLLVIN
jgi:hypothetical protein